MGARLRLEGTVGAQPMPQSPVMRRDAIIYLWDQIDVPGALGYHDANNRGIPYGFVLMELSAQLGEPWSVTLFALSTRAHRGRERQSVRRRSTPRPEPEWLHGLSTGTRCATRCRPRAMIWTGLQCPTSVLPLYFTIGEEAGARNDFIGTALPSFGVNPGGYVGFFDPLTQDMDTWSADVRGRCADRDQVRRRPRSPCGALPRVGDERGTAIPSRGSGAAVEAAFRHRWFRHRRDGAAGRLASSERFKSFPKNR